MTCWRRFGAREELLAETSGDNEDAVRGLCEALESSEIELVAIE